MRVTCWYMFVLCSTCERWVIVSWLIFLPTSHPHYSSPIVTRCTSGAPWHTSPIVTRCTFGWWRFLCRYCCRGKEIQPESERRGLHLGARILLTVGSSLRTASSTNKESCRVFKLLALHCVHVDLMTTMYCVRDRHGLRLGTWARWNCMKRRGQCQ